MLLDISNSHKYARVLLNIVTYNFLLKLYKCRSCKLASQEKGRTGEAVRGKIQRRLNKDRTTSD